VSLLAVCGVVGRTALAAIVSAAAALGATLHVQLSADNDFYSQVDQLRARGLPLSSASLATLPPFLPCPRGDRSCSCTLDCVPVWLEAPSSCVTLPACLPPSLPPSLVQMTRLAVQWSPRLAWAARLRW
jgi:hypothetical protein